MLLSRGVMPYLVSLGDAQGNMSVRLLSSRAAQHTTLLGQFIDRLAAMLNNKMCKLRRTSHDKSLMSA